MKNKLILPIAAAVVVIAVAVSFTMLKGKDSDTKKEEEKTQNTSDTTPSPTNSVKPTTTTQLSDKNPGESINPVDKDKTKASDVFSYKLLDVRKDTAKVFDKEVSVVLVKLEVENISKWSRNTSLVEVRLSKDASTNVSNTQNNLKSDVMYPRESLGIDHGSNQKVLAPNEKVVGYYSYTLENNTLPEKLYLHILNLGNPESENNVDISKSFKVADTFNIK